jgi:DNA-binding IclR family transcriptional regulator
VGSVARAMALLDVLADSESGLGVNELARRIDVNASTASRLLATLQDAGLVERSDGGPYRLGLKLVALSDRVLARLDVRERARPLLARLVAETGETATLSLPGGDEAITVDFVPSASSVVSMARIGRPSVPHATAVGKVMLAFAGAGAGAAASEPGPLTLRPGPGPRASGAPETSLTAFTERTITDPDALAAELERVRERGYAEAVGEREADLGALAAPVFGRGGGLAAILGIQGPVTRLPAATRKTLRAPLRAAAAELGRSLGAPERAPLRAAAAELGRSLGAPDRAPLPAAAGELARGLGAPDPQAP